MAKQQQTLFGDAPAPWEEDDAQERMFATVVLATGPSGEFDYIVPEALLAEISAGKRVQVPLGRSNRTVVGYCVRIGSGTANLRKFKEVKKSY